MARDTQYTLYKTARTDPTFKNIWAFESEAQRETWLNSCSPYPILNNKYWRVGSSIKIPVRYEESFNYDYVRILNRETDPAMAKTWYCFVTSRTYISNNCTLLTLAVDYVQTFYFSRALDGGKFPFWQTDAFIAKGTAGTMPPRGTASEFPVPESVCQSMYYNATGYSVVIYSSIDIRDLSSLKYVSAIIDGQYTAAPPFVMLANVSAIANLINDVNTAGYTDAIAGIYLIPNDYINMTKLSTTPLLATDEDLYITVDRTITKPTSCDGYTPTNPELLGYDYSYFTINNGQGEVSTWHFEDFDGAPRFASRLSLASGSPVLIMYPENYISRDTNDYRQRAVKITQAPSCSFLNDSYKIWLAQTQNSRAAAVNGAQLAISQAKEAREASFVALANQGYEAIDRLFNTEQAIEQPTKKATSGFGRALEQAGKALSESGIWWLGGRESEASKQVSSAISGAGTSIANLDMSGIVSWMNQIGEAYVKNQLGIEQGYVYDQRVATAEQNLEMLLAGYRDKARVPGTAVGSNAYGDVCVLQQYGFMIAVYTPTAFYAEWIDKQLSAGGHVINQYGTITREHAVFDYYLCSSPFVEAERDGRPQYARNMLISLLSQGVYLWYVYQGDISERIGVPYGLSNPEVTTS